MKKQLHEYFPIPSLLAMNSFGIDISDNYILYGELKNTSEGLRLRNFGHDKIPNGIVVYGKIVKEEEFVKILKNLKKSLGLHFVRITLPNIEEKTRDKYLSVFKRAKLIPLSIEHKMQAIARAVTKIDDTNPIIVLDFGEIGVEMAVVYMGKVLFTEYIEADDLIILSDAINKQYVDWRTNDNNKAKIDGKQIKQVIICGKNSKIEGITTHLEESLKMRVLFADVWMNIFDVKKYIPEISFDESLLYAPVIGLELGGYTENHHSSLILSDKHRKSIAFKYQVRLFIIILNLIALISIFTTLLLVPSYFLSSLKVNLAENKLQEFNISNQEFTPKDISNTIDDINSKLSLLSKQGKYNQINDRVLDLILSKRSKGIQYSQIICDRNKDGSFSLEVEGTASNKNILNGFKTTLESDPNIKSVDLPVSDISETSNINFTVSMQVI